MAPGAGNGRERDGGRLESLKADCDRCFGLCCVASAFSRSADFAIDKGVGQPCPHLTTAFRCDIHSELRQSGFRGCAVFDCFGAGQKVSQVTFAGRDWRRFPAIARRMFDVFAEMRQLQPLLWYLSEALTLPAAGTMHDETAAMREETERLTLLAPDEFLRVDLAAHHRRADELLARVSNLVRGDQGTRARDYSRADLAGASLAGADLRAGSLKEALMLGADLRGADLRLADMLGADTRDAQVHGADLSTAIFLTQPQLEAAAGDASTRLPAALAKPRHWALTRLQATC